MKWTELNRSTSSFLSRNAIICGWERKSEGSHTHSNIHDLWYLLHIVRYADVLQECAKCIAFLFFQLPFLWCDGVWAIALFWHKSWNIECMPEKELKLIRSSILLCIAFVFCGSLHFVLSSVYRLNSRCERKQASKQRNEIECCFDSFFFNPALNCIKTRRSDLIAKFGFSGIEKKAHGKETTWNMWYDFECRNIFFFMEKKTHNSRMITSNHHHHQISSKKNKSSHSFDWSAHLKMCSIFGDMQMCKKLIDLRQFSSIFFIRMRIESFCALFLMLSSMIHLFIYTKRGYKCIKKLSFTFWCENKLVCLIVWFEFTAINWTFQARSHFKFIFTQLDTNVDLIACNDIVTFDMAAECYEILTIDNMQPFNLSSHINYSNTNSCSKTKRKQIKSV